jgi:hypothetical protein
MVSTTIFYPIFQMFKNVQLILFVGGDGVPFPVNSLMGYLSGGFDCVTTGLAVYPLHSAHFIIFFLVFRNIDDP